MKTLVWVEHDNTEMKDATLAAVTAATSDVKVEVDFCRCEGVAHGTFHVRPRFPAGRLLVFY